MRQITDRSPTPSELTTLKQKFSSQQVGDWEQMHQNHQVEYLAIREQLAYDQSYFCIYCELCLDPSAVADGNKGHIEHHKPKSKYPRLMFDWDNLMYCCTSPDTCGGAKGNAYFNGLINPYTDPVESWLEVNKINGKLALSNGCPENRRDDVYKSLEKILNLNSPGLRSKRQRILRSISKAVEVLSGQPDALAVFRQKAKAEEMPFITARLQLLDKLIPEG